jgi:hypothetical protein
MAVTWEDEISRYSGSPGETGFGYSLDVSYGLTEPGNVT